MGTQLTSFGFVIADERVIIDETEHKVNVTLPYGTDVTALVAIFAHTGADLLVGAVSQVSGTTANNFTSPVTYTVDDGVGGTQDYTVTATVSSLDSDNALVTLAVFKSYLDIPTGTTTFDERLELAINAASHILNSETDRKLKARAVTLYLDGPASDLLRLPDWPINGTPQVWESTDVPRVWDSTTLIDPDTYVIDAANGRIYYSGGWTGLEQAVKFSGNLGYGYTGSEVPHDLQRACLQIAAKVWRAEQDKTEGRASVSMPTTSITFDMEEALTRYARRVIELYRRAA